MLSDSQMFVRTNSKNRYLHPCKNYEVGSKHETLVRSQNYLCLRERHLDGTPHLAPALICSGRTGRGTARGAASEERQAMPGIRWS